MLAIVTEPTLFRASREPLAARMRPRALEEVLGQERRLGAVKARGELRRRGAGGANPHGRGPPEARKAVGSVQTANTDLHSNLAVLTTLNLSAKGPSEAGD